MKLQNSNVTADVNLDVEWRRFLGPKTHNTTDGTGAPLVPMSALYSWMPEWAKSVWRHVENWHAYK